MSVGTATSLICDFYSDFIEIAVVPFSISKATGDPFVVVGQRRPR